jgi:hypothetical protein
MPDKLQIPCHKHICREFVFTRWSIPTQNALLFQLQFCIKDVLDYGRSRFRRPLRCRLPGLCSILFAGNGPFNQANNTEILFNKLDCYLLLLPIETKSFVRDCGINSTYSHGPAVARAWRLVAVPSNPHRNRTRKASPREGTVCFLDERNRELIRCCGNEPNRW